jgi:MFS family permease
MLVTTLMIMGVSTLLIGFLPTYNQIGIWAPILLLLLRILQGFGVGGEWGGAIIMAVEHSPPSRRGFYGSWPQIGVPAGLLLGTGAVYLFSLLPEEQFLAWGWRIPFLLSIVMIAIGLYIRLKILESPAFQQVQDSGSQHRMPIVEVLRVYPKQVLIAMGLRVAENGSFYVFSVFVLDYVTRELGLPRSLALLGVMIASFIELFAIPFFGALTDRVGRRPVYMFGAVFSLVFAFPFFWLVNTEVTVLIWLAIILALVVGHAAMYGVQGAFFSELFSTRVRYSGASLGYQLASVFAGGLSPFIAVALLGWSGSYWPVAVYLAFMALITIAAVYFATESYRDDIEAPHAAERAHNAEASGSRVR